MVKKTWTFSREIIIPIFLALYLFVFYELILVPAILDWSIYGVGLALALAGLLILSLPAEKRRPVTVLGITFLLAMQAMEKIRDSSPGQQAWGIGLIFLVLLVVGKLLGRFSWRRYLAVFATALALTAAFDPAQVPFWTEFRVKWESPLLYKKLATVDYFPLQLADVDGDRAKEIIVQQNPAGAREEQEVITKKGKKQQILEPEKNYFAVYKWDGQTFREIPPAKYSRPRLAAALPVDYLGYPFYRTVRQDTPAGTVNGIGEQMTPLVNRVSLVEQAARFGSFPFAMLELDRRSLAAKMTSRADLGPAQLAPSPARAVGNLTPGPPAETVAIEEALEVREADPGRKIVGTLSPEQVPYLGTSEVLAGDVDNDRIDELLLTAETSRILKLSAGGQWQTLWASPEPLPDKTRFQHFRFEEFAPLGQDPTPQIIALAKSNVRENPYRYMTGYLYKNGALEQKWRVFSGLLNLRAGDVDGDGQNELAGYMYRRQRVFVLEKHNLPVVPVLYAVTGGLIILGLGSQWRQKKPARSPFLTVLLGACLLLSGCALKSGPLDFSQPAPVQAKPSAGAAEKLARAFTTTARDGKKFWFTGWAATKVQKRNVGFYIDSGTYDRDKGYAVEARVFGQPFRYYRWGNEVYLSEEEKWRQAKAAPIPLEPFGDFSRLRFLAAKAVRLPDGVVLGNKCEVYQIPLTAGEAVEVWEAVPYFDRLNMKLTIWVGKNDNYIYQYKSEATMPVPGAGSMYQEVFFKFWSYNNPGLKLESPAKKIAPYLLKG